MDPITKIAIKRMNQGLKPETLDESYERIKHIVGDFRGPILVVKKRQENMYHGGPGDNRKMMATMTSLDFGVLESELLYDRNNWSVTFPMAKHLHKGDYHPIRWEVSEGPILASFMCLDSMNVGQNVRIHYEDAQSHLKHMKKEGMGIFVGKDAKEQLETFEYANCLKLLGHKVPEELKQEYMQLLGERAGDIISDIKRLTDVSAKLGARIQGVYDATGGAISRGGAITLVENKDDAFWATLGDRDRKKETEGRIREELEDALKLGLGNHELVINGPRPGMTINVPEYINGMCKIYGVKFS